MRSWFRWMAGRTTDASGKTVVAAAGSAASRMIPGRSRDTERASRRDGPDAGGIRRRLQGGAARGRETTRRGTGPVRLGRRQAADPTKPALASSVSLRDCSYDPGPWSRRDHTGLTLAHVRWTRNGSAPPEPVSIADVFKICPNATKACVILTTKLDKRCQYC